MKSFPKPISRTSIFDLAAAIVSAMQVLKLITNSPFTPNRIHFEWVDRTVRTDDPLSVWSVLY